MRPRASPPRPSRCSRRSRRSIPAAAAAPPEEDIDLDVSAEAAAEEQFDIASDAPPPVEVARPEPVGEPAAAVAAQEAAAAAQREPALDDLDDLVFEPRPPATAAP